jgi:glutamine---fructose-6-phosphate transaminase (isomerizing)
MCGIIGYVGERNCLPVLINGLKRLEYRGYDSAGISIFSDDKPFCVKHKGKVSILDDNISGLKLNAKIGIGHTRWATHGLPNEINAHPHFNTGKSIFVIHNGIIENYQVLKKSLEKSGYIFISETDSEVLPHLIDSFLKKGFTFSMLCVLH